MHQPPKQKKIYKLRWKFGLSYAGKVKNRPKGWLGSSEIFWNSFVALSRRVSTANGGRAWYQPGMNANLDCPLLTVWTPLLATSLCASITSAEWGRGIILTSLHRVFAKLSEITYVHLLVVCEYQYKNILANFVKLEQKQQPTHPGNSVDPKSIITKKELLSTSYSNCWKQKIFLKNLAKSWRDKKDTLHIKTRDNQGLKREQQHFWAPWCS